MVNPWLRIPASDDEAHMRHKNVAQQQFLATTFKASLEKYESRSLALLGCATGNGLEYATYNAVRRVTAIDINPEYLEILRQRYEEYVPGLEIINADLETYMMEDQAYSLILAGLIFEYVDPRKLLSNIARGLCPGGVMVSILQMPAEHSKKISGTPYKSLNKLHSIMKLIPPVSFKMMANNAGLQEIEETTVRLQSGKPFYIGAYALKEELR
jgi:SAM-dependent methyltransferase